jgi:ABC-type Fe3+-hydroxamate transport system substrate-binding protein
MVRMAGVALLLVVLAGCSSSSSSSTTISSTSDFCSQIRSYGPTRVIGLDEVTDMAAARQAADAIRQLADETASAAEVAPAAIASDLQVVSEAFDSLRPYLGELETGQLDWNKWADEHLGPLLEDQSYLTANGRVQEYEQDECGVTPGT